MRSLHHLGQYSPCCYYWNWVFSLGPDTRWMGLSSVWVLFMLVPITLDFTLGNYLRKCVELHTNLHLICVKNTQMTWTNTLYLTTTIEKVIMYHIPYVSDVLVQNVYICRSGCDPPSKVWIHLTLCSKFGIDLWSKVNIQLNDSLPISIPKFAHRQTLITVAKTVVKE